VIRKLSNWAGDMTKAVKHLSSKLKVLSLNLSTKKKKNKKKQQQRMRDNSHTKQSEFK
jgi:hypothetical protein